MISPARLVVPVVILAFALSRGVQRVLTALTLEHLGPWSVSALSLAIACILWFPFAATKGWLIWDRRLWARCAPLGLVNIAVPAVAFIAAQQFITASTAALLVAAIPLVVAALAAAFLSEHLRWPAVTGIGVGAAGVITLTLGKGGSLDGSNWWLGLGLVALGVLAAASVYVGWRGLLAEYQGVQILAPQLAVSAFGVLPVAFALDGLPDLSATLTVELTALALTNYVLPQLAMFWLLARTTAVRSSLANYLAPLFATVIAVPVLGQEVTPPIIAGGILIVAGAALVNTARNLGKTTPKASRTPPLENSIPREMGR